MKTFVFKLSMDCEECGSPIALNGPVPFVSCSDCNTQISLEPDFWQGLLESTEEEIMSALRDDRQLSQDTTAGPGGLRGTISVMGCTVDYFWGPAQPQCNKCLNLLEFTEVEMKGNEPIFCVNCGHQTICCPTPDWLQKVLPRALFVVGAIPSNQTVPKHDSSIRPILFSCLDCDSVIRVSEGTPRVVRCDKCNSDNYIPNAIWYRLHPESKRKTWYMIFGAPEEIHGTFTYSSIPPKNPSDVESKKNVPISTSSSQRPLPNSEYTDCAACGKQVLKRSTYYTLRGIVCYQCYSKE